MANPSNPGSLTSHGSPRMARVPPQHMQASGVRPHRVPGAPADSRLEARGLTPTRRCFPFGQRSLCCGHDGHRDHYAPPTHPCRRQPAFGAPSCDETIRLAVPMALTQLGQIVMMTTDLVLIGRLGDAALAAAALAHTVLFAAFTLGMGLVSAVAPLASQAYGARAAAHGAPRAARRPVGGGDPGRADDAAAVLGRGHPGRARPAAPGRRAGGPISRPAWPGPSSRPGRSSPCATSWDAVEPARAGTVDHAGRHPDSTRCWPTP